MPGENRERGESSDEVIYTSAGPPLFNGEKQMPAKRGRGKSLQGETGTGGGGGSYLPKQSATICCEQAFKYWGKISVSDDVQIGPPARSLSPSQMLFHRMNTRGALALGK